MSNLYNARISLKNSTGYKILAELYYKEGVWGHTVRSSGTIIEKGATAFVLNAPFSCGWGIDIRQYWFLAIHVLDTNPANQYTYASGNTTTTSIARPVWADVEFGSSDNTALTWEVTLSQFIINRAGKPNAGLVPMRRIRKFQPIQHVFVVMLENRSFDNLLAFSGIDGITHATTVNSNTFNNKTYNVTTPAPFTMPTGPAHEFNDALTQLCGTGQNYQGGAYPPIDNSGFVVDYALSTDEGGPPTPDQLGGVMACFQTPDQLPVLQSLASQFAVCDQWYSSLPGPTWPNRFFVHCGSSDGFDDSPEREQIGGWLDGDGFSPPNGTVFQKLPKLTWPESGGEKLSFRIYNDSVDDLSAIRKTVLLASGIGAGTGAGFLGPLGVLLGTATGAAIAEQLIHAKSLYSDNKNASNGARGAGWVPQSLSLQGVKIEDIRSMGRFELDLKGPYDAAYTFIEPHYGNVTGDTFKGGSSQHPRDDMYGGEALVRAVYQTLRNSPLWYTSLLIVTYDEHGGFYDSMRPPPNTAPAPGDGKTGRKHDFDFKQYGVRVPAIVISPMIPKQVSHVQYDHASVLKVLESCFGMAALTDRDRYANDPSSLCILSLVKGTIRTACPTTLPAPAKTTSAPPPSPSPEELEELEAAEREPLPQEGNIIGFLHILAKIEIELSDGSEAAKQRILADFDRIQTRGDAANYAEKIWKMLQKVREQRAEALAAQGDEVVEFPDDTSDEDRSDDPFS